VVYIHSPNLRLRWFRDRRRSRHDFSRDRFYRERNCKMGRLVSDILFWPRRKI